MPGVLGYDHDGGVQPHEHRPTEESRQKVIGLSCSGCSDLEIAEYFDIHTDTLKKHYKAELKEKKNRIQAISDVAYALALEGNQRMIDLILKCQGNWYVAKSPDDVEKDKHTQTLMEKLIDKL